ncbi:iron-containing alcohol dehydrogenase family protein [Diaminobutyricimonas sp. TR449]|uniref:iron-containing alcohol dehydrogenase family protein n=1 Tax=Diaminobutyricimonas sp. TR449 TaxID=2708076 RepID=UPI001AB05BC6|nr:iron-containing alcohol dehydrogenase family protein [Diaminobutyricimonas sp. TR449]
MAESIHDGAGATRVRPVSLRHIAPSYRTYAGGRSLTALGKELDRAGSERVVLICGASMLKQDAELDMVQSAIGKRLAGRFSDTREHSPLTSVEAAARMLDEREADAVVVLGGGSAVVTARAAVILSAEQRPVKELATRRENGALVSVRLEAPKITQWIVPSTPTTAYAKAGAAVRDPETGERFALFDPKARAAGVFMHPTVAATAPGRLVRGSALNAFGMAVDGLQSGVDDPLAEAQLRHALRMLRQWLPRIEDELDGEVGVRLMLAALLAGQASDHVGTGLAQPISHALGPRSAVGNGVVEAMMLPHTMRFNLGRTDAGLAAVAEALDPAGNGSPESAIAAVMDVLRESGVPLRLRDVGVDRQSLDEVIQHVADDWSATTVPRPAQHDELHDLLTVAW